MEPESCNEISELLDAYQDDEATALEREAVEKHLGSCQACIEALEGIKAIKSALAALPRLSPSRDLVDQMCFDTPRSALDAEGCDCAPLQSPEHSLAAADVDPPSPTRACPEIAELLDAFHDNELANAERQAVENHLDGCQGCRHQLQEIATLVKDLKALPRAVSPRDFAETLDFSRPTPAAKRQRRASRIHRAWWAAGATAAAAVLISLSAGEKQPPMVAGGNQPRLLEQPDHTAVEVASAPEKPGDFAARPFETRSESQSREETPGEAAYPQSKPPVQEAMVAGPTPRDAKSRGEGSSDFTGERSPTDPPRLAPDRAMIKSATVASAATPDARPLNRVVNDSNSPAPASGLQLDLEIATISDDLNDGTFADALGITTDEDGLYEIKI